MFPHTRRRGYRPTDADDAADIVVTLARFGYTRLIVAAECESIVQIPVDEIEELLS